MQFLARAAPSAGNEARGIQNHNARINRHLSLLQPQTKNSLIMRFFSTVLALTSAAFVVGQTPTSGSFGSLPSGVPLCAVRSHRSRTNSRFHVHRSSRPRRVIVQIRLPIQHVFVTLPPSSLPLRVVSSAAAAVHPTSKPHTPTRSHSARTLA